MTARHFPKPFELLVSFAIKADLLLAGSRALSEVDSQLDEPKSRRALGEHV